jgi:hypothetical protein
MRHSTLCTVTFLVVSLARDDNRRLELSTGCPQNIHILRANFDVKGFSSASMIFFLWKGRGLGRGETFQSNPKANATLRAPTYLDFLVLARGTQKSFFIRLSKL